MNGRNRMARADRAGPAWASLPTADLAAGSMPQHDRSSIVRLSSGRAASLARANRAQLVCASSQSLLPSADRPIRSGQA
jgi:hypothetical protein